MMLVLILFSYMVDGFDGYRDLFFKFVIVAIVGAITLLAYLIVN